MAEHQWIAAINKILVPIQVRGHVAAGYPGPVLLR